MMTAQEEIARFGNIKLAIHLELDTVNMPLEEILGLRAGAVVKFARPASEDPDVCVGGVRIGTGELVEVNGSLGVRINEVASEEEER